MADSPQDILAKAADLLAELAGKATPGPWEWQHWGDSVELVHPQDIAGTPLHPMNVLKAEAEHWPPNDADQRWIALMSPFMASRIEAWLRGTALRGQFSWDGPILDEDLAALQVAQIILERAAKINARTYRNKPVEIQAMRWDGTAEGTIPIIDWVLANGGRANYYCYYCTNTDRCATNDCDIPHTIAIRTLEDVMHANFGDWIIRGVKGEFYPCRDDIFQATYEEVSV
ncbi:hypothetical protein [Kutzneria albida]|uniref:Phage protein n=1 Tax=Kutzneria albida DSM 43870 TaxID=1449976 RepID=W5WCM1_9PSEU|nr:hypothetical protein [Kutzneria albida]AHH98296.1 hypothetical protein KALB_4934 [Kutzneria albida DSM 43870]